jgi:FAD:protein FMN transferase
MDISDSVRRTQPLLGTFVEIAAAGADRDDLQQAIDKAFAAVAQVHRLMSFHDPHNDVSRLNREASTRAVPVTPGPIRSWKWRWSFIVNPPASST